MSYTHTINCKIPTDSSTPIVTYDSDYKSLDFYHANNNTNRNTGLDKHLQNVSIDSDGTFTKRYIDHRDETQLGFNVQSDYSKTVVYDPIRSKQTRFYPSIYSADLKIGFHNQLKLSGYLTNTTDKAIFHSVNSNADFQIENVDFLSQFFNRQNKTLKKYDYSWNARLVNIESGGLNYADGVSVKFDLQNGGHSVLAFCNNKHTAQAVAEALNLLDNIEGDGITLKK